MTEPGIDSRPTQIFLKTNKARLKSIGLFDPKYPNLLVSRHVASYHRETNADPSDTSYPNLHLLECEFELLNFSILISPSLAIFKNSVLLVVGKSAKHSNKYVTCEEQ